MSKSTARRQRLARTIVIAVAGVAAAVGLAVLAVYVVAPWFQGSESETDAERPRITASAGGVSVAVEPFIYCEVTRPDICDPPGETVELPVAAGQELTVALPESLSDAPWILATFYVDPAAPDAEDSLQGGEQLFAPGTETSVSVPDIDEQGRVLAGVEVRLPTGLYNPDTKEDTIVTHATWSVATR